MSDEADIEALAKAVLEVQGTALACQLIIKALLVRAVLADGDPKAALRKMFEQVSADLDRGQETLGNPHSTSISGARQIVNDVFSSFDRSLSDRAKPRKSGKGPA